MGTFYDKKSQRKELRHKRNFAISRSHLGDAHLKELALRYENVMLNLRMANVKVEKLAMCQKPRNVTTEDQETICDMVVDATEHGLAQRKWQASLQERSSTDPRVTAANLLRKECAAREET